MKKIPSVFVREYTGHRVTKVLPEYTSKVAALGFKHGEPTIKVDGACCYIDGSGNLWKRYDAKKGKTPPVGAIPCQPEPDPITGHYPHWVNVTPDKPEDKWFREAMQNSPMRSLTDNWTYEAVGPHFQGNPYKLEKDILIKHGTWPVNVPRTLKGIRGFLEKTPVEGLVFWIGNTPICKIKRSDFGFPWPCEGAPEMFRLWQEG